MKIEKYWPPFLQEIEDFKRLAYAEQPELDALQSGVSDTKKDFFLSTLTEEGIRRWEKILGITPLTSDTLQARRNRIQVQYADQIPYTYRYLVRYLHAIDTRITASVLFYDYTVKIGLPVGTTYADILQDPLRRMIPANMIIDYGSSFPMQAHAGAAQGFNFGYMRIGA